MSFAVRAGTAEDFDAVMRVLMTAFHDDPNDQELIDTSRLVYEPRRSLLAVDADEIVGHAAIFSRELTVPGAVIPAAFVTMVGVAGGHTRRGIASTLLTRQLREAPEPVALLLASEGRIYQRFGYGMASRRLNLSVDTREARLNAPPAAGSLIRVGSPHDLRKEMTGVYEAVRRQRPGYAGRNDRWWDFVLADAVARRGGAGPLLAVVHEGPSGVDGYALYRVRRDWDGSGPKGEVRVAHTVTANPVAYQEIWRYLLSIDLTRTTSLMYGAIDEPLFEMVNEPRRLNATLSDGLWLRIVDVPAALAARRYLLDDLVIEVNDPLLPANTGRFRLDGTRTADPADIALDAATLGTLYLGGGSVGALTAAGRVTELRPGAIARADVAFRWHQAPVGIEMF